MHIIRISLVYVIISFLSAQFSVAQSLKSFTADSEIYLEELGKFLMETDPKKGEDLIEELRAVWVTKAMEPKEEEKMYKAANAVFQKRLKQTGDTSDFVYSSATGKLTEAQKEAIFRTSNAMLKKRMKAFPDFSNYMFTLMAFVNNRQTISSFNAWQEALEKLIARSSSRKFVAFLDVCKGLFSSNILYKSGSTSWTSSSKYYFDFDSVPIIYFPDITLTCNAKRDSAVIHNTKGIYYPTEEKFRGEGGRVNWMRAGIDSNICYATLKNFTIDVSTSKYTADSVMFYYSTYFEKPMLGQLTEKILSNVTEENATYPRFDSYDKRIVIKELHKNIDYDGGFSMHGAKLLGSGGKNVDAMIIIKRENPNTKKIEPFMVARSKSFVMRKERISSEKCGITMYMEKDSIHHPGLEFKFIVADRELALIRNDVGLSKSPYFNSFHKVDMFFDALYWKIDDPNIELKMISGGKENKLVFESSNLYEEFRFARLQGMDDVNPLQRIKRIVDKTGTKKLNVTDVASEFRLAPDQVRQLLMSLSNLGFLIFDIENDQIVVKDKLLEYLAARAARIDYDVIQFNSVIERSSNATINLLNYDIRMRGVGKIYLSDSQNVYIFPKEQEIILRKNRDFFFDGRVIAGRFDFHGKDFSFEYDNFRLQMNIVDSLKLKVPVGVDEEGREKLASVRTVLRDLSGNIEIDHPYNKSGLKDYSRFPIFNSLKDSYAFYDGANIHGGVYKRDNFYFQLKPFMIDSLDNFTGDGLAFDGTFVSASIFPDFEETLKLQPDMSLGFVRKTPAGGFPAYTGKGQYENIINLSHRGLRGDGTLKYLTSVTESNDYYFFPDSMNTVAQTFEIHKQASGTEYPPVKGVNVNVHWMPYMDLYQVKKIHTPLALYDGQTELHGGVDLRPRGLTGYGQMNYGDSELDSKLFKFGYEIYNADSSDFRLKADGMAMLAFSSSNVRSKIDTKNRLGEFKVNDGSSAVNFPINKYICYMDAFKWDVDKKFLEFTSSTFNAESEGIGSRFVSVHPAQDSLDWVSPAARFSLKDFIITANEVKFINVADALIYPDKGEVVVHQDANMQQLEKSKILANRITKYHNFYDCSVKIHSRKRYIGKGTYDYVDATGGKKPIVFESIGVDSTLQTLGEANIPENEDFSLSMNFDFKGKVILQASNRYMTWAGGARIKTTCEGIGSNWLKFRGEINPTEIYIPIEKEPKDANNMRISSGVVLAKDSAHVYSTFLSKKRNVTDPDIIPVDGYLHFDETSKEYRISNIDKLKGNMVAGNFLSLNSDCITYGQGKLDLNCDFGQVKLTQIGTVTHNRSRRQTKFDMVLGIDFFFNEKSMAVMADKLENPVPTGNPITFGPNYENALLEVVGKERANKLLSEINLYGAIKKLPAELSQTFLLTDVKLQWNTESSSYRYQGFIGVANVGKTQINKLIYGSIELVKKRSGDILYLYLEPSADSWFFFHYSRGLMAAVSSNAEFNTAIRETKPDKRQVKPEKGQTPYQYIQSTEVKKRDFLKGFAPKAPTGGN